MQKADGEMTLNRIHMRESAATGKHYNCIDLTKFICAVLVILIHVPLFVNFKDYSNPLLNYGAYILEYGIQKGLTRIAVPFFFVCSGFFLFRKSTFHSYSMAPTKGYIQKLLRLYVIWTVIYLPLMGLDGFRSGSNVTKGLLLFCRNFVFTGSYIHLWYLPADITAVLLVSYLLKKRIKPVTITGFAAALYLVGLLAQSWFGLIHPIKEMLPPIWSVLKAVQAVIVTTRNGLFEGFLFVSLGMLFAFYEFRLSKKSAAIGFAAALFLMLAEALILNHIGFIRASDLYLFLPPSVFFLFSIVSRVELDDQPLCSKMRNLSSLMFYMHMWVREAIYHCAKRLLGFEIKGLLHFGFTLLLTLAISYLVLKLSEQKRFRWMKKLYS